MKKILLICMILFSIFSTTFTTFAGDIDICAALATSDTYSYNEVTPQADITGWRYKNENGVCYKRLFNYTKGKWIGDWIRC